MAQRLDNLLIHIGYHKTATTWLQQHLFTSDNPFFEPVSKTKRGHSTLARHFIYDDESYLLSPFEDNEVSIKNELEALKKAKGEFGAKIPIISHERLSGNPHSGGFDAQKIALRLKNTFPGAKILIVIREQRSFLLSNYFQYLSIGGTHSLEKYLSVRYDGKRPCFSPHHIEYLPLIKAYLDLYGAENVLVLPYEMFRNQPLLFLSRLSEFLDIELSVGSKSLERMLNRKKFYFVTYYTRWLNVFRKCSSVNDYSPLSNRYTQVVAGKLLQALGIAFPSYLDTALRQKLKLKISQWCGDRYVESNQDLSQLIGMDLSKYGYH